MRRAGFLLLGVVGLTAAILFVRGAAADNRGVKVLVENRSAKPIALLSGWGGVPPWPNTELFVGPRVAPGEKATAMLFDFVGTVRGAYIVGASRDLSEPTRPKYLRETRELQGCPDIEFSLFDPSAMRRVKEPVELIVQPDGSVICKDIDRLSYRFGSKNGRELIPR